MIWQEWTMFSDAALLINYNYSKHIPETIDMVMDLYRPWFKDVFIYTDSKDPVITIPGHVIHFTDQWHGAFSCGVISDFAARYPIENYSGVFFIMDDCLLNISLLNSMDDNKVIYDYLGSTALGPLREKKGWHWDYVHDLYPQWGIGACTKVLNDPRFTTLGGRDLFANSSGDYVYIPRKYLAQYAKFCELFYDHRVWLEIAIASCLAQCSIEDDFNTFEQVFLWNTDKEILRELIDVAYINERIKSTLLFHPVRFSRNKMRFNQAAGLMERL